MVYIERIFYTYMVYIYGIYTWYIYIWYIYIRQNEGCKAPCSFQYMVKLMVYGTYVRSVVCYT
jgi:hypothetical protein